MASQTTTDHDTIRRWAQARNGRPASVRGTGEAADPGIIRIDFPGYSGTDTLQEISWDDWFQKFEEQRLALVYQEQTEGGETSNFNKLVSRDA